MSCENLMDSLARITAREGRLWRQHALHQLDDARCERDQVAALRKRGIIHPLEGEVSRRFEGAKALAEGLIGRYSKSK